MATKFDRPEAWRALDAEDREFWARRTPEDRAASVLALSMELWTVGQDDKSGRIAAADRHRRDEKLRAWILLKERLRCQSASQENSRTFSPEH